MFQTTVSSCSLGLHDDHEHAQTCVPLNERRAYRHRITAILNHSNDLHLTKLHAAGQVTNFFTLQMLQQMESTVATEIIESVL